MEDFHNAIQLKNIDGYLLTVLDGHGGIEVAKYANKKIHLLFDNFIKDEDDNLSLLEKIKNVLSRIYNTIENELFTQAFDYWKKGYGKLAFVGTCAITIIINNSNLYIANLGDSKARLYKRIEGVYSSLKISKTYNANKISERVRLSQRLKDKDLFVTNDGVNFYVKGRLIPTRVYML
jgi:serine/threonine protein phosphatase PrpC